MHGVQHDACVFSVVRSDFPGDADIGGDPGAAGKTIRTRDRGGAKT